MGLSNCFAHSARPGIAPAAWERGPQEVETSTQGVPKRAPGGQISGPKWSSGASWGVLGARSASGGRSGREKGSWTIVWRALGTVLGLSWRLLGRLSPPGGGPERLREVIFRGILGPFLEVFWAPGPRS